MRRPFLYPIRARSPRIRVPGISHAHVLCAHEQKTSGVLKCSQSMRFLAMWLSMYALGFLKLNKTSRKLMPIATLSECGLQARLVKPAVRLPSSGCISMSMRESSHAALFMNSRCHSRRRCAHSPYLADDLLHLVDTLRNYVHCRIDFQVRL